MIHLTSPIINKEMIAAALNALENEHLVLGESVYKFEEEFADYIGVKHAISVNSGTSALSLSLIACGINHGDKVLTTPVSFIATSNAIIHSNGIPIFSDIEMNTGNINLDNIHISKDIKGVIPVHLFGNPCNVEKLLELKEKGLFIIEDACQAHGAEYKKKKIGSFGDVGCFSFYSTKNMTVGGDGGMITTNNDEIADKLKILRDCGRIGKYEHGMIGYTARLNTVNAAIGRVQLKYLDEWNRKRKNAAKIYRKNLPDEILLKDNGSVYHIFAILSKKRKELLSILKANDIDAGIHYPTPIHLQPIYKKLFGYKNGDYPVAEEFSNEILSLPMFPDITKNQIEFICEKILTSFLL